MALPKEMPTAFRGQLLNFIDADKRRRLLQFSRADDLDRSLIADVAIRYFAMCRYGWRNNDIRFTSGAHGKPVLAKPSPFEYNISHSGRYILCVVSEFPVGCDIEAIGPTHDELVDLVFTPEEILALKEAGEEERASMFYWLWTRKESYVKAIGEGLSDKLHHYSVLREHVSGAESWQLRSYHAVEGYALAICLQNGAFPETLERVDTMDLLRQFLDKASSERG